MEGAVAGEHFGENHAQSPNIATPIDLPAHSLFGRHVANGADDSVLGSRLVTEDASQAEVNDLDQAGGSEHDIGGLDVAMDNAAGMGFRQAGCHLRGDIDGFVGGERAAANTRGQREAVVEGHDNKGLAVGSFLDSMNHTDVGMIEGGGGAGLAQKSRFVALVGVEVGRQELESNSTLQAEIERTIHFAHSTGARDGQDAVVAGDNFALREAVSQLWHGSPSQRPGDWPSQTPNKDSKREVIGKVTGRCAAMVQREKACGNNSFAHRKARKRKAGEHVPGCAQDECGPVVCVLDHTF